MVHASSMSLALKLFTLLLSVPFAISVRTTKSPYDDTLSEEDLRIIQDSAKGLITDSEPTQTSTTTSEAGDSVRGDIQKENGGPCNCVKYWLCDAASGKPMQEVNGTYLLDIRSGVMCGNTLEICCDKVKQSATMSTPTTEPMSTESSGGSSTKPRSTHKFCGIRHENGIEMVRILGGTDGETQFGEFPWVAAITEKIPNKAGKPFSNLLVCEGSLIHPKVVLTAAHCIFGRSDGNNLVARLGEWDTQTTDEILPYQERNVSKMIMHERYDDGSVHNDIALLITDQEFNILPNVDTICLPPRNANFDGQTCFAAGWGKTSFEKQGAYQVILKKVELPMVSHDDCQTALRTTRLSSRFHLHESFTCAGGEAGKDTCRGDGGAPLMCKLPDSNYYAQAGIVSWGIGCGRNGIPGVYTDVKKFLPWIERKFRELGIDTKYYKDAYDTIV